MRLNPSPLILLITMISSTPRSASSLAFQPPLTRTLLPPTSTNPQTIIEYRSSTPPPSSQTQQTEINNNKPLHLHYFGHIEGKGEALRLSCFYAGIEFDDNRYTKPHFLTLKSNLNDADESGGGLKFPNGQFPVCSLDDGSGSGGVVCVGQSQAILRLIGNTSNSLSCYKSIYPTNPIKCAVIDSVLDLDADLFQGLLVTLYKERYGFDFLNANHLSPLGDELTAGIRKELNDVIIPRHLKNLERSVIGDGWLAGAGREEGPSIADFSWAVRLKYLAGGTIEGISRDIVKDNAPKLVDVMERVYSLERVKLYYELQEAAEKEMEKDGGGS